MISAEQVSRPSTRHRAPEHSHGPRRATPDRKGPDLRGDSWRLGPQNGPQDQPVGHESASNGNESFVGPRPPSLHSSPPRTHCESGGNTSMARNEAISRGRECHEEPLSVVPYVQAGSDRFGSRTTQSRSEGIGSVCPNRIVTTDSAPWGSRRLVRSVTEGPFLLVYNNHI
jgi:hypothetical protein